MGSSIFLSILLTFLSGKMNEMAAPRPDVCRIFGGIYIEQDKSRAQFYVFEEETEGFADLLVFEEENRLFADQSGVWYFTEERGLADFTIWFTESRSAADFSVYFTDVVSFAGCK